MISPDETFNAFEASKLNRNKSSSKYSIIGNIQISQFTYILFNFVHLMNRTVSSIHSVSWVRWLIVFYRFFLISIAPTSILWNNYIRFKSPFRIISYILVYIRYDDNDIATISIFVIYVLYLVVLSIMFGFCLYMIKKNRRVATLIHSIFFCTYLVLPLLSGSMAYVFTHFIKKIFTDPSIGHFFLSAIALIALAYLLIVMFFSTLISGSNPIPEVADPLAVWSSNCKSTAILQAIIIISFVVMSINETTSLLINGILQLAYSLLIIVPFCLTVGRTVFCVAYWGYEFTMTLVCSCSIVSAFVGALCIADVVIPFYAILIVWIALPFIFFLFFRLQVNVKLSKIFDSLDAQTLQVMQMEKGEETMNGKQSDPNNNNNNSPYDHMNVRSAKQAVEIVRAACVFNSQAFLDLSLIKWVIAKYPDSSFELLQLAFLIPNEDNLFQSTFECFQQNFTPKFFHIMIIFQMVMSIQESSNDLTPTILRDVSRQRLSAMKCQSIVTKFWTSCYKGDISQMSRMALNLQTNIERIDAKWRHLLSRYPRSHPILKEYLQFLNGVGCQHGLSENIVRSFPSLADPKEGGNEDDANLSSLQHSIEKSVDKRPIKSINGLRLTLLVMIILSIIFVLISCVFSIVVCSFCSSSHRFIQSISEIESSLGSVGIKSFYISDGIEDARESIFESSIFFENAIINAFRVSSDNQFDLFDQYAIEMIFRVEEWDRKMELNIQKCIHILSYYAHTMPYVSPNDSVFSLYRINMPYVLECVSQIGTTSLDSITGIARIFKKYGRIFHAIVWGLLVILIFPMMSITISNVKAEMTYLFAFYINIPHSMLAKFAEGVVGVSAGKSTDKKSQLMRLSASFVQSKNETNEENDNNQGNNVADGFKIIVGDTSNRASVLPKNFILKCVLVIGLTSAFFAAIASASFEIFRSFIMNYSDCLWTERAASSRLSIISSLCAIVSSYCDGFSQNDVQEMLDKSIKFHMALFSIDKSMHISSSAVSTYEQQSLLFDERCPNQTEIRCRSFSQVFDYFTNSISLIISSIWDGSLTNNSIGEATLFDMRKVFIDELHPMLWTSFESFVDFSSDQIRLQNLVQTILIVGSIVALALIGVFVLLPITSEIDMTLYSVRLPMKLIHPLDLVEVPRLVQFLQGECDWSNNSGTTDKGSEKAAADLILNVLRSPLGVFGSDLSLLLANDEFYMLLNTSREACVGLPLSDIFSSVIPFERDEAHPFNSLLATVSQLQRGISPVNVLEVNCDLQVQGKGKSPVLIRLVGISETQNNAGDETVCADHFAIFITDLKPRKILEEKMRFESDMATKLIEAAIPRTLAQSMQNVAAASTVTAASAAAAAAAVVVGTEENQSIIHTFENIPMVMFQLKYESVISDADDNAIRMFTSVMKSVHEANQIFAAMCRLIYKPPFWLYVSGVSVGVGDPVFCISEACLFAASVVEKFNEIEHDQFSLSIAMHYGSITIVTVPLELPVIEIIGHDYQILREVLSVASSGMVFGTEEMANAVNNNQTGVTASPFGRISNEEGKTITLFTFAKTDEIITD